MKTKNRKPLVRKTELRRTGFKRKENRECVKASGPRVVKKFSTLKAKPLKRSPEWLAYKAANDSCEAIGLFPPDHPIHEKIREERKRLNRKDQIHHILWGQGDREEDIPTNIIRLCATVHDWVHANKWNGMSLCLWRKHLKGELSWSELERIGGKKKYPGSLKEPAEDWIKKFYHTLIGTGTGTTQQEGT